MPNFALNDTHTERFSATGGDNLAVAIAARNDAIQLCREGAVPAVTSDDMRNGLSVGRDIISLDSYDETTDLTDGLSQLLTNTPATTIGTSTSDQADAALRCKAFFEADLSTSASDVESSKTQSLQGTGIEFGYDFEKYSLSFNQLQWSGGDDKLQAQMLLFRYPTLFLWAGVLRAQTRHRIWFGFGHSPRGSDGLDLLRAGLGRLLSLSFRRSCLKR